MVNLIYVKNQKNRMMITEDMAKSRQVPENI